MKYRKFGKCSDSLSEIGFGCWELSGASVWTGSNDKDGINAVHCAIDQGINFFDVAPVYGFGHAEEVLGRAIKGKRDKLVIASKCGLVWDYQFTIQNCLKPESVMAEIDRSLQRLGVDYIDIYQLHWPDYDTPLEDTIQAIQKIKESGKIRNFGISNFPIKYAEVCLKAGVVSHQCLYNMFDRNSESYHGITLGYRAEDEVIPWCDKNDVFFIPYSPLCQGLLSDIDISVFNMEKTDIRAANPRLHGEEFERLVSVRGKLQEFAREIGVSLAQVAIRWILRFKAVGPIISGSINLDDIKQNAATADMALTEDMISRLNQILEML